MNTWNTRLNSIWIAVFNLAASRTAMMAPSGWRSVIWAPPGFRRQPAGTWQTRPPSLIRRIPACSWPPGTRRRTSVASGLPLALPGPVAAWCTVEMSHSSHLLQIHWKSTAVQVGASSSKPITLPLSFVRFRFSSLNWMVHRHTAIPGDRIASGPLVTDSQYPLGDDTDDLWQKKSPPRPPRPGPAWSLAACCWS